MNVMEQGLDFVELVDNHHRFTLYLESRRVFDVLVNLNAEVAVPEGATLQPGWSLHPILIAQVDAPTETARPTKGYAAANYQLEDLETGFIRYVQPSSVVSYVNPRTAHFLARLFVPPAA